MNENLRTLSLRSKNDVLIKKKVYVVRCLGWNSIQNAIAKMQPKPWKSKKFIEKSMPSNRDHSALTNRPLVRNNRVMKNPWKSTRSNRECASEAFHSISFFFFRVPSFFSSRRTRSISSTSLSYVSINDLNSTTQKSHLHIAVKYAFKAKIHITHDIKPKFYEIIYYNNCSSGNRKANAQ